MSTKSFPSPTTYAAHASHDETRASEAALMALVADGDDEAFAEIYRRHARRALSQARKLGAHEQLAEEVTQDAFLCLWRGADRYQPALGSVSTWLSRIVRNRAVDAWRRTNSRPVEVQSHDEEIEPRGAITVEASDVDRDGVLAIIAELPLPQREAVFLAYFGGLTHREIAIRVGAPLGTVKGRIRLGLRKLAHAFPDHAPALGEPPEPTHRRLHLVPDDACAPRLKATVRERPAA